MYNFEKKKQSNVSIALHFQKTCTHLEKINNLKLRTMPSAAQLLFVSENLHMLEVRNSETDDQAMTSQLIYKCDIKIFTDLYLFVLLKNNVNSFLVRPRSTPICTTSRWTTPKDMGGSQRVLLKK